MLYLSIGLLITIVAAFIGAVVGDWYLSLKLIGGAALIPLLLSGLLTGAFVNGDRNRANFQTETKEDRKNKNKWVVRFLLLSAPNLCLLIILLALGLMR